MFSEQHEHGSPGVILVLIKSTLFIEMGLLHNYFGSFSMQGEKYNFGMCRGAMNNKELVSLV